MWQGPEAQGYAVLCCPTVRGNCKLSAFITDTGDGLVFAAPMEIGSKGWIAFHHMKGGKEAMMLVHDHVSDDGTIGNKATSTVGT